MEWNGMEWNGIEWNGMEWNDQIIELSNGLELEWNRTMESDQMDRMDGINDRMESKSSRRRRRRRRSESNGIEWNGRSDGIEWNGMEWMHGGWNQMVEWNRMDFIRIVVCLSVCRSFVVRRWNRMESNGIV